MIWINAIKRLPDAEFELMRILWSNEPPMSTNQIIAGLDPGNTWKPQTVLTLLVRLIEKGFLDSEKVGKERTYAPRISREEYLRSETGSLFDKLHGNSIFSLVNALYDGKRLSKKEIADLRKWLDERTYTE
ncbi:MAG: BlaI/MecI/CopY family transcriptional regulator [Clostridiales bacterium]|nr:BlaI/MecI/CopY family transcriptional regulator [Clostridiales bacterium]